MGMTAAEFGEFLLDLVHKNASLLPDMIVDSDSMAAKYATENDGFYVKLVDGSEYQVTVRKE